MSGAKLAGVYTSFDSGPVQFTGNPLDLALSGNSFFVLDGPNGPVYTRNGSFELNGQGDLQSHGGLAVRSTGGRLNIPPNTAKITVAQDGTVLANNVEVGKLQLAEFSDPNSLERAGTTLFQGPAPRQPDPGTYRIEQGYQEGSNVQIVNEMVATITGMRYYEAAQRALRALGDTVALDTNPH
jgi:flagellar basal body rod protein FlgG